MKRRALRWPVIEPPDPAMPLPPVRTRLLWMTGIWAASVLVLVSVAAVLRWMLPR